MASQGPVRPSTRSRAEAIGEGPPISRAASKRVRRPSVAIADRKAIRRGGRQRAAMRGGLLRRGRPIKRAITALRGRQRRRRSN